jgi:ribosomal protein S18 acetylase RimI-like enzyme
VPRFRAIDVDRDRGILLELHCRINYASDTPWARAQPYERYREKWLTTSQPESYLAHLAETLKDERTIAEMWEDEAGAVTGYLWVTFTDMADYEITVAEVMDIAVVPEYQQRGIGLEMLKHAEEVAHARGARLLRSDTGVENVASQRLHEKTGFKPYRIQYEKALDQGGEPWNLWK